MLKARLGTVLLALWGIMLTAFVYAYVAWLQPSRLGSTVSYVLESTLGVQCDIGRASLSFLPLPEVAISDLSLRRGSLDHLEFKARQASIQVSWFSLLRLKPIVRTVSLDSPTLDVSGAIMQKALNAPREGSAPDTGFTMPDIPRYITGLSLDITNGTCRFASADGKDSLTLSGLNAHARVPSLIPGSLDISADSIHYQLASGIDLSAGETKISVASLFKGLDREWEGDLSVSTNLQLGSLDTAMGRRISDPFRYFPMPEPLRFSLSGSFSGDPDEKLFDAVGRTAITATLPMNGHNVPISLDVPFTIAGLENGIAVSKADVRMGDDRIVIDGIINGLNQGAPELKGRAKVHHFSLTRWFGFGRLMDPGLQHALDDIRADFHEFTLSLKGVVVPSLSAEVQGIKLKGSGSCTEFLKPVVRIDAHAKKADLNRVFTELHGEFPDLSHLPPPVLPLIDSKHEPASSDGITVGYDIHISADDANIMGFQVGGADVHVIPAPKYGTMLTIDVADVYGGKAVSEVYIQNRIRVLADLSAVSLGGPSAALAGYPVLTGGLNSAKVDISFAPGSGIEMLTTLGGTVKADMKDGAVSVKGCTPLTYKSFTVDAQAEASSGRGAKTMPPFVDFTGRWNVSFDTADWSVRTEAPKATLGFSTVYGLPGIIREQTIPLDLILKKSLCSSFREDQVFSIKGKTSLNVEKGSLSIKKGTAENALFRISGDASFTSIFKSPAVSGHVRLSSSKVRKAAHSFGIDLPATGPGAFSEADLQASFDVSSGSVSLADLHGSFDGTDISGGIAYRWSGRPSIEGSLKTRFLDLDRYLPEDDDSADQKEPRRLLPLDFLKGTDIALDLKASRLKVLSATLSQISVPVTQKDGHLNAPVTLLFPSGGMATGFFKASCPAKADHADVALQLHAPKIDMQELCRLRGHKTVITGMGSADTALRSQQKYWDDWKHTLNGYFTFLVKDGAILSPPSPDELAKGRKEPSRTNFKIMSMSGTVDKGIVSCKDFSIKDSMLDVSGRGSIDLAQETIDAHATITLAGIPEMPVEISGNLFSPTTNYKLLGAVTGTVGNIGSTIFDLVGTVLTAPFRLLSGGRGLIPLE